MGDLKLWGVWAIQGITAILLVLNWFWIKRWITDREKWEEQHDKKESEQFRISDKEGGVVTRDTWFRFCEQVRSNCPAIVGYKGLDAWRMKLFEEGGPVTQKSHKEICQDVVGGIGDKIDECFANNRDLVVRDIALMMAEIKIDRKTIEDIKTTVDKNENKLVELARSFETVQKAQQRVLQKLNIQG